MKTRDVRKNIAFHGSYKHGRENRNITDVTLTELLEFVDLNNAHEVLRCRVVFELNKDGFVATCEYDQPVQGIEFYFSDLQSGGLDFEDICDDVITDLKDVLARKELLYDCFLVYYTFNNSEVESQSYQLRSDKAGADAHLEKLVKTVEKYIPDLNARKVAFELFDDGGKYIHYTVDVFPQDDDSIGVSIKEDEVVLSANYDASLVLLPKIIQLLSGYHLFFNLTSPIILDDSLAELLDQISANTTPLRSRTLRLECNKPIYSVRDPSMVIPIAEITEKSVADFKRRMHEWSLPPALWVGFFRVTINDVSDKKLFHDLSRLLVLNQQRYALAMLYFLVGLHDQGSRLAVLPVGIMRIILSKLYLPNPGLIEALSGYYAEQLVEGGMTIPPSIKLADQLFASFMSPGNIQAIQMQTGIERALQTYASFFERNDTTQITEEASSSSPSPSQGSK